jgi:hypothetical protein
MTISLGDNLIFNYKKGKKMTNNKQRLIIDYLNQEENITINKIKTKQLSNNSIMAICIFLNNEGELSSDEFVVEYIDLLEFIYLKTI